MSFPAIPATMQMLRVHMLKQGYSNTTLATDLEAFGGAWTATFVGDLMTGRKKLTTDQDMFIKRYLLQRFVDYNVGLVAE